MHTAGQRTGKEPLRDEDVMRDRPIIVAVDGPAGSGKSSICHRVCARVGWTYINTGALYRAVGLLADRKGVDTGDEGAVSAFVDSMAQQLKWNATTRELWYQGENLTPMLGSEQAGNAASKVAKMVSVRAQLLPVQRDLTLAAPVGALVDGRDIGTVVFPDADLKVFLTASLEERSRRRLNQLEGMASEQLQEIMRGIAQRDEQDEARGVAPLKQAEDAIVLDSSMMGVDETVETLIQILRLHKLVP